MRRYLKPVEAARAFGVTAKALRVYEARGLLTPGRTSAGWRAYSPEDGARVYEIMLLKSLGLSLQRIAALIKGRPVDVDRALALQQGALEQRLTQTRRAIGVIARTRARIAACEELSADDLILALRETSAGDLHWGAVMERYYSRVLTGEDWRKLDPKGQAADWTGLIAELRALVADKANPCSAKAQRFMDRWRSAADAVTSDKAIHARTHAAWKEALSDGDNAARLPLGPAELDYLARLGAAAAGSRRR